MKKKSLIRYLIIFLSGILIGCTNMNIYREKWQPIENLALNWDKVRVGDIIVKNKTMRPLEWYGHIGVVVSPYMVADYPHPLTGYNEYLYRNWLNERREVIVLRLTDFNEEFKKEFIQNVEKLKNQRYLVTLNKNSTDVTYCSKYVWYLFKKTGESFHLDLDLDVDGGPLVFPYDFLIHPELEVVEF
ncbi:MAG: hypothetical protein ACRDB2_07900 [Fusobacteriaceae bacterium]